MWVPIIIYKNIKRTIFQFRCNVSNRTPISVLDNGIEAENRYELIDMKSTASSYASGNTSIIDRKTYDKLIEGLKKLSQ